MIELFKSQIDRNILVTKEMLSKMDHKFYENGEPIQVGDKILFALLKRDEAETRITENLTEAKYKLITLTEAHFDFFECVNKTSLPILIKKRPYSKHGITKKKIEFLKKQDEMIKNFMKQEV